MSTLDVSCCSLKWFCCCCSNHIFHLLVYCFARETLGGRCWAELRISCVKDFLFLEIRAGSQLFCVMTAPDFNFWALANWVLRGTWSKRHLEEIRPVNSHPTQLLYLGPNLFAFWFYVHGQMGLKSLGRQVRVALGREAPISEIKHMCSPDQISWPVGNLQS